MTSSGLSGLLGLAKAERVKNELNGDCFDDLNIHDLRHTGITNMLERGVALPLVASMIGHKAQSVMTLKVYTKFRQKLVGEGNAENGSVIMEKEQEKLSGFELVDGETCELFQVLSLESTIWTVAQITRNA